MNRKLSPWIVALVVCLLIGGGLQSQPPSKSSEIDQKSEKRNPELPVEAEEPFVMGQVWKGTLTQEGLAQAVDVVFRVSSRDGINYQGDWLATTGGDKKVNLQMKVRGTIKPSAENSTKRSEDRTFKTNIEWFVVAAPQKSTKMSKGEGAIQGVAVKGSWQSTDGSNAHGDFQLERVQVSHWMGYTYQPEGIPTHKWSTSEWELLEQNDGKVTSAVVTRCLGRAEHAIYRAEGKRDGNKLQLGPTEIIFNTAPPPGATRWLSGGSSKSTFGPYGSLTGTWTNPRDGKEGLSNFFAVRMDYKVVVQRQQKEDNGLTRSTLFVNGTALGDVYEDTKKLMPAGRYPGRRLFVASTAIVQNSGRRLGKEGDFLLAIVLPKRKPVLFVPGDKAEGLGENVLAGAAIKKGDVWLAPPTLAALRWHFYGTDNTDDQLSRDPLYLQKENNMSIEVRDARPNVAPLAAIRLDESAAGRH